MPKLILCGNANSGKTTIFNYLTRKNLKTGNWLGVSTQAAEAPLKITNNNLNITVADLPGIYSLNPVSEDEKAAALFLEKNKNSVILNIADINNLKRSLYLTLKLLEQGFQTILVLSFAKNFNGKFDIKEFEKRLGIPVIIFNRKTFKEELNKQITNCILKVKDNLKTSNDKQSSTASTYKKIDEILNGIYKANNGRPYGFSRIDKIILNKFLAIPIFACVMLLIFYLAFGLAGNLIAGFMEYISSMIFSVLTAFFKVIYIPDSIIIAFNEVITGGITAVINFCGQIFIILLCLNILEHSGYISRLAFVLDDFFEFAGLSGKGIFTFILGLGCATSAIPFSRVVEDKNSKIKTSVLTPLLPCTAKLPICALICTSFFPNFTFLTMFLVYFISVLMVLIFALILNRGKLKTKKQNHILEFPSYKIISPAEILKTTFSNLKSFIGRILTFTISINIVIFLLSSITLNFGDNKTSAFFIIANAISVIFKPLGFDNPLITSSLISGLMAKELIVSTLAPFLTHGTLAGLLSINQAISFLIFSLFFSPCFSTLYVLKDEFNLKTALFTFAAQFAFAYAFSFIVYNCLILNFTSLFVIISVLTVILIIMFLVKYSKKHKCELCGKCDNIKCKY